MQQPLDTLTQYWGYTAFREPQEEVITSVLQGKDTFALMPTGGGKSVCFQVPALVKDGLCLVISPLIALMKDQVASLAKKNIKAIALTGGISTDDISVLLDNCRYGNYKFLYLSPERLQADWIVERLKELPINLIAIDEAHCVSQWGHDFRPAYLKIGRLKQDFPDVPFLALTASATKRVQQDIVTHLGMEQPKVYVKSFARENLAYMVFNTEDKLHRIRQILTKNLQSSIIYVRNRKACHDVAEQLGSLGFTSTFYHGGLRDKEKDANMKLWMNNSAQVMVATNAFGMGIDKPDVKTVIHLQLPENVENYYQEAGRAGRNGQKAFAILLVSTSDAKATRHQFLEVLPDKAYLREVYSRLNNYLQIAYGEGIDQTYPFSLNDFCNTYKLSTVKTYNTLQFLDRQGVIALSNEFTEKVRLQFLIPGKEVTRYISLNPADEEPILALLRNYPGIFEMELPVNVDFIATKAKLGRPEVMALLERLRQKDVVTLRTSGTDSTITFNEVREDDRTINRIAGILEQQNKIKKDQYDAMIAYTAIEGCKSRAILEYFGEATHHNCGICSWCLGLDNKRAEPMHLAGQIMELLQVAPLNSRDIEEKLRVDSADVLAAIRLLLSNEHVIINTNNQYTLK